MQATRFELTPEVEDELLDLYQTSPEQLERLQRRIARAKANSAKIEELTRRRDQLLRRNGELAETAGAAPPVAAAATVDPPPAEDGIGAAAASSSTAAGSDTAVAAGGEPHGAPVPRDWSVSERPFQYRGPPEAVAAGAVVSAALPGGQLFRLVTARGEWAFYNDTRHSNMQVRYILDAASAVEAVAAGPGESERTRASRLVSRLPSGQWEAAVLVPPEETVVLFRGSVAGFEAKCRAVALTLADAQEAGAATVALSHEALEAWGALEAAGDGPFNGSAEAEAVLAVCLRRRLTFVDPTFLPGPARLFRPAVDAFFIPPLHWRAPASFLPPRARGEARLFIGPVSANSIHGAGPLLPNHSVVSVIAALAATPRAVGLLFTHPEAAAAAMRGCTSERPGAGALERMVGAHRVQLCLAGWWRSLLIDSFLPATQHRPEFGCCRDDLRALWLPLLEKAYAKAFGSYAAMVEATVPDVVANLTGAMCCSMAPVWPSTDGATAAAASPAKRKASAPAALAALVRRHLQRAGPGGVLLRAFPLSRAKSQGRRDRLGEIYRALGVVPGSTVRVLGADELTSGETILRIAQNTAERPGRAALLAFWRQLQRPWVDGLWELELVREAEASCASPPKTPADGGDGDGDGDGGVMWMDLADAPQFFAEGFLHYPTTEWAGGEVRARGAFADGRDGAPSVCLRLEVTAPATVMLSVTQQEQRLLLASRRLARGVSASPAPAAPAGARRDGSSFLSTSLLADDGEAELRGVALQIVGRAQPGGEHVLLGSSSNSTTPDLYALDDSLQYTFQRAAGVGVQLTPEGGPYYIVPRVSPRTAPPAPGSSDSTPYVLAVTAQSATISHGGGSAAEGADGAAPQLRVGFVELLPAAPLLKQPRLQAGSVALRPETAVKETVAEYQICRTVGDQRCVDHNRRVAV